jgi:drug/metabolite transporter (DMT)-like permease
MISSSNLRGIICMVLAGLTFVSCDAFLKLMLLEGVPPLQTLVLRGISATVWCFVLVFATGNGAKLSMALNPWVMLRSSCEVVAVSCFIIALANVPLADVTAIYQIAPLLVLVAAAVLWGENVGWLRWLLIGLGLAGALLVAQPGREGASPYAFLAFITAIASAARDVFTRKVPHDVPGPINTINVVIMVMLSSYIMSTLFEVWKPVTQHVMFYGLASGFFVMLGHLFVFLAFRLATARAVAPFYYSLTVFAVLFGAVFFIEVPNLLAVAGIGLIIACGLGVLALENRKGVQS